MLDVEEFLNKYKISNVSSKDKVMLSFRMHPEQRKFLKAIALSEDMRMQDLMELFIGLGLLKYDELLDEGYTIEEIKEILKSP